MSKGSGKVVIITSKCDTCFNALREFAQSFSDGLEQKGYMPVICYLETLDERSFYELIGGDYEAFVCFQNTIFTKEVCDGVCVGNLLKAPLFEYVFDPPAIILQLFRPHIDGLTFLYHDRGYISFLNRYFPHVSALLQYPAGGVSGIETEVPTAFDKRVYDCSFVGMYHDYRRILKSAVDGMPEWGDTVINFFEYLIDNPNVSAEQAIVTFCRLNSMNVGFEEMPMFYELLYRSSVDAVRALFREKCILSLLNGGINVDVFSKSWNTAPFADNPLLHVHGEMSYRESMAVFSSSKVSLNLFSWHKDSMTERIANIMLNGAVCVSDRTGLLTELFEENREILTFDLERMAELPEKVRIVLEDDKMRLSIARAGYVKAYNNHRWINRVDDFIDYLSKEMISGS